MRLSEVDSYGPRMNGGVFKDRRLTPEERLLLAILALAFRDCITATKYRTLADMRSARLYFESPVMEFGSFAHFCDHFELSMEDVKKRLGTL